MTPTRRDLLGAAGLLTTGLLAGCLADARRGGEPTDTPTPSTTPTSTPTPTPTPDPLPGGEGGGADAGGTRPAGTGGPGVTLVGVDGDRSVPVAFDVEVVESTATMDHPPALRVRLTNTGSEAVRIGEGRAVRFQYVVDDSRTLQLLPAAGSYPVGEGNCWRLTDHVLTTEEYRTETLAPGEVVEATVELYALPEYDGCLPVGEYRFETTVAVGAAEGTPGDDAGEERADWGFSVLLE